MKTEDEVGNIIDRCIYRAMPKVEEQIGYTKYTNGETGLDDYLQNNDLISACVVREELEHEIANYLRIKEAEVNSKLTQAKCEAYELALTHTRPIERLAGGKE